MDTEEKKSEYFIARYSLIPDSQMDLETVIGITKEEKFLDWINSFQTEKKKEVEQNGCNYILYCKKISEDRFFMSFAKETNKIIGEKTDEGIVDSPILDYKKSNILINTRSQIFIIQRNPNVSSLITTQKNVISKTITKLLESKFLYFQLDMVTERNDFWKYIANNAGEISDLEIKLSSPNLFDGIITVSDFLRKTNKTYNNTSFSFRLSNEEGNLNIDPNNPFLQDAIRYSTAGCGSWKAKNKGSAKWYRNTDTPYLLHLPDNLGQLKDSDLQDIDNAFKQADYLDPENKEG